MNEFLKRYKDYSDSELIRIIDNALDYQPLAVEAAKIELTSRNLSNSDLENAKRILTNEKFTNENIIKLKQENFLKITDSINTFLSSFNLSKNGMTSSDKIIKIIAITFSFLYLFSFVKKFKLIWILITKPTGLWDFFMVIYILPLIVIPPIIYLFWKKRKIGWILFSSYIINSFIGAIISLFYGIKLNRSEVLSSLDNIFPQVPLTYHIFAIIFFGSILYTISKKDIRSIFEVNYSKIAISIGIGVISIIFTFILE